MKVIIGKEGTKYTYQNNFPESTICVHCNDFADIAFVYYEDEESTKFVYELHKNKKNNKWLHDNCAVAIYFCRHCLETTSLYNQA